MREPFDDDLSGGIPARGCLYGALAWMILWLVLAAFFNIGCCHTKTETITVPVPVEIEVPVTGQPLAICHDPEYQICDQPTAAKRVVCIGQNHVALVRCHEQNVATMEGHNAGLEVDGP